VVGAETTTRLELFQTFQLKVNGSENELFFLGGGRLIGRGFGRSGRGCGIIGREWLSKVETIKATSWLEFGVYC
jgi:hypothetical protein